LSCIIASRETSLLGDTVYRYYTLLNMGSLFLKANERMGYPIGQRVVSHSYLFDTEREVLEDKYGKPSFLNPISHFFTTKMPWLTGHGDSIAEEEIQFVRNVGSLFTYGSAAGLVLFTPKFSRRLNMALTASSIFMDGCTNLLNKDQDDDEKVNDPDDPTQPGLLRGGYGGQLTFALTGVSLLTGYLLENGKMSVPKFYTPMKTLDGIVDNAFEWGTKIY